MIELKNITKVFAEGKRSTTALSNVSLFVPEGRIFGVIGESGAGKSTLIRCVNLLERPTSGEVLVDGKNMMALSNSDLTVARRSIGMIFQHFNLLSSRTVFDNIAFPLELNKLSTDEIKRRVTELLELVGLESKALEYPSKLSGGQKQRVAIARALANNPKVLLCDEATSALDPATTRSILTLLKDINRKLNLTILLITHEMDVVKSVCDEVAVLNQGQLIEQGSIADVFSHPKHDLTKHFIASSLNIEIPIEYKERLSEVFIEGKHKLITLEISGQSEANAALSDLSRLFNTKCNIVCAQMDYIAGVKFGAMLIELLGDSDQEELSVKHLRNKNIEVNDLGYV